MLSEIAIAVDRLHRPGGKGQGCVIKAESAPRARDCLGRSYCFPAGASRWERGRRTLPAGWSSPFDGRFGRGRRDGGHYQPAKTKWCERRQKLCPLRGGAESGSSSAGRPPLRTPPLGWRFCGALSQRTPGREVCPLSGSPYWQPAEKVIGSRGPCGGAAVLH